MTREEFIHSCIQVGAIQGNVMHAVDRLIAMDILDPEKLSGSDAYYATIGLMAAVFDDMRKCCTEGGSTTHRNSVNYYYKRFKGLV
jgi:hypothetical protein